MKTLFCSRVGFTFMGASPETFYINNIKSVEVDEREGQKPFVKINRRNVASGFIGSYKDIVLNIYYFTYDDTPTFDFSLLPYGVSIPLQITLYKPSAVMSVLTNVSYNGMRMVASGPNESTVMMVSFLATDQVQNTFIT